MPNSQQLERNEVVELLAQIKLLTAENHSLKTEVRGLREVLVGPDNNPGGLVRLLDRATSTLGLLEQRIVAQEAQAKVLEPIVRAYQSRSKLRLTFGVAFIGAAGAAGWRAIEWIATHLKP